MSNERKGFRPTGFLMGASLCLASLATVPIPAVAQQACQAGQPGCVLPVGDPPPPPVTTTTTTTAPTYVDDRGGIGWWPILLGLAALGAALYFFVLDDDDDDVPVSP